MTPEAAKFGMDMAIMDAIEKGASVEEATAYIETKAFTDAAAKYAAMYVENFGA